MKYKIKNFSGHVSVDRNSKNIELSDNFVPPFPIIIEVKDEKKNVSFMALSIEEANKLSESLRKLTSY